VGLQDGRAPLHYLCSNRAISALVVEILFDACPSAASVADLVKGHIALQLAVVGNDKGMDVVVDAGAEATDSIFDRQPSINT
jgi:hypothetical protein